MRIMARYSTTHDFLDRCSVCWMMLIHVSSNTKVIERATLPRSPFTPNIQKSATTGAMIGLLIGILLIVAREFFDRTFKNQADVEDRLKFAI